MDDKESPQSQRIPSKLLITFKWWPNFRMLRKTRKAHQKFFSKDLDGGGWKISKYSSKKYTTQVVTHGNTIPSVVAKFRTNLRKILVYGQEESSERAISILPILLASKRMESVNFHEDVMLSVAKRIRAFRMLKDLRMRISLDRLLGFHNLFKECRYIQSLGLDVASIEVTGTEEERRVLQFFKNLSRFPTLKSFDFYLDPISTKPDSPLLEAILSTLVKLSVPSFRIHMPIHKIDTDIEQIKEFFSKLDFLNLSDSIPNRCTYSYRGAIQKSHKIGEFFSEFLSVNSLHQILENSTSLKTLCIGERMLLSLSHSTTQSKLNCCEGLKNLIVKAEGPWGGKYSLGDGLLGLCDFLLEVTGLNNIYFKVPLTDKESVERFTRLHQLKCMKSIQSYILKPYNTLELKLEPLWTEYFNELSSFSCLKSLKLEIYLELSFSLGFLERLLLRLSNLECLVLIISYQSPVTKNTGEIDFYFPFENLPELKIFALSFPHDLTVNSSQNFLKGMLKLRKIHTVEVNDCLKRCPENFLKAKITQIFTLKSIKTVCFDGIARLWKPEGEELTLDSFFNH